MLISAVILTKNEEKNIESTINSVLWCDEIIVIDDNSIDKTVDIAKKLGSIVYKHELNNDFAAARNFALEKCKGEWILFLDGDERISESLAFEIQGSILHTSENIQGYFLKRIDTLWSKKLLHGETGSIKLLRLGKKDSGKWVGQVHETWNIKGKTQDLKNPLYHYPHPSLTEFLQEINFYTDLRAQELFDKKINVSIWQIIFYPKAKFFVNYFFKRGFLDGIPGLVLSILMSFHSFLVRGKLWILWHKKS